MTTSGGTIAFTLTVDAAQAKQQLQSTLRSMVQGASSAAANELGGITRTIDNYGRGYSRIAASIGFAASAGFGAAIHSGLAFTKMLQTQAAQFDVLLGSASAADAKIKELINFSRSSPFSIESITDASQRLTAMTGAAFSSSAALRTVGDAAATLDQSMGDLAQVVGKVFELTQAGNALGRTREQLIRTRVTTAEVVTQMERMRQQGASGDAIFKVFTDSLSRFGGGMEKQIHTLAGAERVLGNLFKQIAAAPLKPFINLFIEGAVAMAKFAGTPAFDRVLTSLNQQGSAIAHVFGGFFKSLNIDGANAAAMFTKMLPIVTSLAAAMIPFGLARAPFIGKFVRATPTTSIALGLGALAAQTPGGQRVLSELGQTVARLTPAVAKLADTLATALTDAVSGLSGVLASTLGVLTPFISAIGSIPAPLLDIAAATLLVYAAMSKLSPVMERGIGFARLQAGRAQVANAARERAFLAEVTHVDFGAGPVALRPQGSITSITAANEAVAAETRRRLAYERSAVAYSAASRTIEEEARQQQVVMRSDLMATNDLGMSFTKLAEAMSYSAQKAAVFTGDLAILETSAASAAMQIDALRVAIIGETMALNVMMGAEEMFLRNRGGMWSERMALPASSRMARDALGNQLGLPSPGRTTTSIPVAPMGFMAATNIQSEQQLAGTFAGFTRLQTVSNTLAMTYGTVGSAGRVAMSTVAAGARTAAGAVSGLVAALGPIGIALIAITALWMIFENASSKGADRMRRQFDRFDAALAASRKAQQAAAGGPLGLISDISAQQSELADFKKSLAERQRALAELRAKSAIGAGVENARKPGPVAAAFGPVGLLARFVQGYGALSGATGKAKDEQDLYNQKVDEAQIAVDDMIRSQAELAAAYGITVDALEIAKKRSDLIKGQKEIFDLTVGAQIKAAAAVRANNNDVRDLARTVGTTLATSYTNAAQAQTAQIALQDQITNKVAELIPSLYDEYLAQAQVNGETLNAANAQAYVSQRMGQANSLYVEQTKKSIALAEASKTLADRVDEVRTQFDLTIGAALSLSDANSALATGFYDITDATKVVARTQQELVKAQAGVTTATNQQIRAATAHAYAMAESGQIGADFASIQKQIIRELTALRSQFIQSQGAIKSYEERWKDLDDSINRTRETLDRYLGVQLDVSAATMATVQAQLKVTDILTGHTTFDRAVDQQIALQGGINDVAKAYQDEALALQKAGKLAPGVASAQEYVTNKLRGLARAVPGAADQIAVYLDALASIPPDATTEIKADPAIAIAAIDQAIAKAKEARGPHKIQFDSNVSSLQTALTKILAQIEKFKEPIVVSFVFVPGTGIVAIPTGGVVPAGAGSPTSQTIALQREVRGKTGWIHTGGIIPNDFSLARRYHMGGLASDEYPGILRRGEWVTDNQTVSALGSSFMRSLPALARRPGSTGNLEGALLELAASMRARPDSVTVNANTNADPNDIADRLAWEMRSSTLSALAALQRG